MVRSGTMYFGQANSGPHILDIFEARSWRPLRRPECTDFSYDSLGVSLPIRGSAYAYDRLATQLSTKHGDDWEVYRLSIGDQGVTRPAFPTVILCK